MLQVKYFDSGDYNMAKSNSRTGPNPLLGKAIPTAEAVTQRKHSTACKSKLADGEEHSPSHCAEHTFFGDNEKIQIEEKQEETEWKWNAEYNHWTAECCQVLKIYIKAPFSVKLSVTAQHLPDMISCKFKWRRTVVQPALRDVKFRPLKAIPVIIKKITNWRVSD